ncbi:bifunctional glycosyltransferase family 2/GtrA family protein [Acetobacterium malicum]|uniref:bifunctional glycosyltransferase family 2/GtrA family protein n=1 Tax=Acetobacterium malicum TaxID=52692 RepID=UPI0004169642|nr:bifunctional glycosyltransferase family 2/GtrA family protein [Acetobacterium dehalogenans]
MKPIVIIPALNPDEKLVTLVEQLKQYNLTTVIVNDGSTPGYEIIFDILREKLDCVVCVHTKNMGKGVALKTGIAYAANVYPDAPGYVTADADGQHSPEDILKVVRMMEKNSGKFILGTRDFNNEKTPFKSKWGNRITSFAYWLTTGERCPDTQTGLRGIPMSWTKKLLEIPGDRYEYEMNVLLEAGKSRIPFVEIPIETIYLNENKASHFHAIKDSARIYLNILKFSLSSFVSAIVDNSVFTLLIQIAFGSTFLGILEATIIARVMSGGVNYILNKHWVFQNKDREGKAALQYAILFISQMLLSWFFVSSLSSLPIQLTLLKICVDTGLFFGSYLIQKNLIFGEQRKEYRLK